MMLDESPANNLLSMPPRAFTAPNGDAPLTRVSLLYIEQHINLYLRFGCPLRVHQIDRWRRCAVFPPAQLFCRIRWESNDYGTTRWQLMAKRPTARGYAAGAWCATRRTHPAERRGRAKCARSLVPDRRHRSTMH